MKLTPLDIQRHEFQQRSFRGLDSDEVRTFLIDVSEEMEPAPFRAREAVGGHSPREPTLVGAPSARGDSEEYARGRSAHVGRAEG